MGFKSITCVCDPLKNAFFDLFKINSHVDPRDACICMNSFEFIRIQDIDMEKAFNFPRFNFSFYFAILLFCYSAILLFRFCYITLNMEIPKISVLSPLVTRVLGCNPGKFTLQGTNTYLIGNGPRRVLIDSGEGNSEYTNLLDEYTKQLGIEISAIFLTHWHKDHINGVEPLLKRFGPRINAQALYKYKLEGDDERYPWTVQNFVEGQVFKGDGFTLTGYHTPGHAKDHLVFWLEEENVLFSGDNILGHGTAVFENLKDYVDSLSKMLRVIETKVPAAPHTAQTYPGHGHYVADSHKKISEYIQHRGDRENDIVRVLETHHKTNGLDTPVSVASIVSVIYKDYPENIWPAAERGVHLHLQKLRAENRVKADDGNGWKLGKH